jgi:hypothetical protein
MCFAACAVHLKATVPAEKGVGDVLSRKPRASRNSRLLGPDECQIEQIRTETVGLLRTMLAAQIGFPELIASFDKPCDADGAGVLVNG